MPFILWKPPCSLSYCIESDQLDLSFTPVVKMKGRDLTLEHHCQQNVFPKSCYLRFSWVCLDLDFHVWSISVISFIMFQVLHFLCSCHSGWKVCINNSTLKNDFLVYNLFCHFSSVNMLQICSELDKIGLLPHCWVWPFRTCTNMSICLNRVFWMVERHQIAHVRTWEAVSDRFCNFFCNFLVWKWGSRKGF